MTEDELTSALGALPKAADDGLPACPDEHVLAGAVSGRLDHDERQRFERHAVDCDRCLARLSELARLGYAAPAEPIPDALLERAISLGARSLTGRLLRPRLDAGWAAAASVVLALGLVFGAHLHVQRGAAEPGVQAGLPTGDVRATRTVGHEPAVPRILQPRPGEAMQAGDETVKWTPVAGSLYYDVRLVNDRGDVLWQERVADTTVSLPASLPLQPGTDYYVRVDVYFAEAMSVSSPHVLFRIRH